MAPLGADGESGCKSGSCITKWFLDKILHPDSGFAGFAGSWTKSCILTQDVQDLQDPGPDPRWLMENLCKKNERINIKTRGKKHASTSKTRIGASRPECFSNSPPTQLCHARTVTACPDHALAGLFIPALITFIPDTGVPCS